MVCRVLDLLRRPKILIAIFCIITSGFIAESVQAADKVCSQKFPDKCSDRYLCFVSTALDKQGTRNWISTDFNGKYQLEAKQRNLDCNVGKKGALPDSLRGRYTSKPNYYTQCQVTVEQVKKLQGYLKKLDLYAFGIDGIAGKGTITGLKQAKKLIGYTSDTSKCFNDKHLVAIKQFIQQTACSEGNLRGCTDVEICSRATTVKDDIKYWDRTSDGYLLAIDKGLDCDVDQLESNSVINPTGSADLQSCSPSEKKYSVSPLADPADLAIREGASVEYPVIENLKKNQRNIAVTGQYYAESFACQEACTTKKFIKEKCIQTDKLWLQVSTEDNKIGWVKKNALQHVLPSYQDLVKQITDLKNSLEKSKLANNQSEDLVRENDNLKGRLSKLRNSYDKLISELSDISALNKRNEKTIRELELKLSDHNRSSKEAEKGTLSDRKRSHLVVLDSGKLVELFSDQTWETYTSDNFGALEFEVIRAKKKSFISNERTDSYGNRYFRNVSEFTFKIRLTNNLQHSIKFRSLLLRSSMDCLDFCSSLHFSPLIEADWLNAFGVTIAPNSSHDFDLSFIRSSDTEKEMSVEEVEEFDRALVSENLLGTLQIRLGGNGWIPYEIDPKSNIEFCSIAKMFTAKDTFGYLEHDDVWVKGCT